MALLRELFYVFGEISEAEQRKKLEEYRSKRNEDLSDIPMETVKKVNSLTDEERNIMKMLGITARDLKILKESLNV